MKGKYYLYILTNLAETVLYVGVTNNLFRRIWDHKHKNIPGFTADFNVDRLMYFEELKVLSMKEARAREIQVKAWKREWKMNLINSINPEKRDLYPNLFKVFK